MHPFDGYKKELTGIEKALATPGMSSISKDEKIYIDSLLKEKDSEESNLPPAVEIPKKLDPWKGKDFKREEATPTPEPEIPRGVSEEQMALNGFTLFSVEKAVKSKLSEGLISLNTKSGYNITFNRFVSEEIMKAKHPYLHVWSKEGSIYFLFDNYSKDSIEWRTNERNVKFSHKKLILNIKNFFGLKNDIEYLVISKNRGNTDKDLFYKITKKQEILIKK